MGKTEFFADLVSITTPGERPHENILETTLSIADMKLEMRAFRGSFKTEPFDLGHLPPRVKVTIEQVDA